DAHVAIAAAPREEVDADVRTAALQVEAQIHPAALAGVDDAIAEECHVRLPLRERDCPPPCARDTWRSHRPRSRARCCWRTSRRQGSVSDRAPAARVPELP